MSPSKWNQSICIQNVFLLFWLQRCRHHTFKAVNSIQAIDSYKEFTMHIETVILCISENIFFMVNDMFGHQRLLIGLPIRWLHVCIFPSIMFSYFFSKKISNCIWWYDRWMRKMWVNAFHVILNGFQINWYF